MVLNNIVNRRRFNYQGRDILDYLIRCLCIRNIKKKYHPNLSKSEWKTKYRTQYLYNQGEDRLFEELDVINLLKSIRRLKLLNQIVLT